MTGMSGAGRTTLPQDPRGPRLRGGRQPARSTCSGASCGGDETGPGRLAIGIDSRTRGFAPDPCSCARCASARASGRTCLLFLECDDEVLRRRFTETRRRHPLADLPGVGDALAAERELMAPLKAAADMLIDTTDLSLPDLRRLLTGRFGAEAAGRLAIAVRLVRLPQRPAARGRPRVRRPLPAQPALCRRAAAGDRARRGGPGARPRRPGVRAVRGRPAGAAAAAAAALPQRGQELPDHRLRLHRRAAPLGVPGRARSAAGCGPRLGGDHGAPRPRLARAAAQL